MKLYTNDITIEIDVKKNFSSGYDLYINDDFYCTCEDRNQVDEEILDLKKNYHASFTPCI